MSDPSALDTSIISLGHDLFSMKLYWFATSALWFYDYFLTLGDEVRYAWRGDKKAVFYLYILNRYLTPCYIIITIIAYALPTFDLDVCARYGFMETFETMTTTFIAELFLMLRVYALSKKHKGVLVVSGLIMAWQWGIAIYAMSQSDKGTPQPALLLSRRAELPPLPPLPNADPYHLCIFISTLTVTPWVEAWLCLSLAFDGLAFIAILTITLKMMSNQEYRFIQVLRVIQRDGIMYFFVLFSSNLVWLLLLLHARPGLKFMHNQPAMVLSGIMINRITLNLKKASDTSHRQGSDSCAWCIKTFEQPLVYSTRKQVDSQTLVNSEDWAASEGDRDLEMQMQSLGCKNSGKQG